MGHSRSVMLSSVKRSQVVNHAVASRASALPSGHMNGHLTALPSHAVEHTSEELGEGAGEDSSSTHSPSVSAYPGLHSLQSPSHEWQEVHPVDIPFEVQHSDWTVSYIVVSVELMVPLL